MSAEYPPEQHIELETSNLGFWNADRLIWLFVQNIFKIFTNSLGLLRLFFVIINNKGMISSLCLINLICYYVYKPAQNIGYNYQL